MIKRRSKEEVEATVEAFANGAAERDYAEVLEDENRTQPTFVETSDCIPWEYHNRHPSWFEGEKADNLRASIDQHGQQQSGLVRRSTRVDSPTFEIIFGARRWSACRQLDIPFNAKILPSSTSDAVCASLMEDENQQSENITELERAVSYKAMLDGKVFGSQAALGDSLRVSKQYASKLITSAALIEHECLGKHLKPHIRSLTIRDCVAINAALGTHGATGRMERALSECSQEDLQDARKLVSLLIKAVERPTETKERVLMRTGKKKTAVCKTSANGALTLKVNISGLGQQKIEELCASFKAHLMKQVESQQ